MRRCVVFVGSLLVCLLVASSARADSIPWITGGFYSITDSGDSYRFQVANPSGEDILSGSASSVAGISQLSCYICDPGATFTIGRHTVNPLPGASGAAAMGTGTFTSGGLTKNMRVEGWLAFLADSITLPALANADISFDVPFSARVSFSGSDIDNPGGGVFARWRGAGVAHVSFTQTADGRWSNTTGELLRFDFSNATPVPEPASMFLIGTGLAGLGCALRKREKA